MTGDPNTLRARFVARRHTALLVAIVSAFGVRPLIGDSPLAPVVFSIAMLGLLLIALVTTQIDELVGEREVLLADRRRRRLAGAALAALAVAERVAAIVSPSPWLRPFSAASWSLFLAFVTWSQLRTVLKQREVTGETISNAVTVYLLFGATWGLLYALMFDLQPQSFTFPSSGAPDERSLFAVFTYFSMTTLSTVGFGDIVPVSLQARYAAVVEGIAGQFYLAILVARLVSMHMSRSEAGRSQAGR